MSSRLYYLLTLLPSLPQLGQPLVESDAYRLLKEEGKSNLDSLSELLELEFVIQETGLHHFVMSDSEYEPVISEDLPEDFRNVFFSYKDLEEADWLTAINEAWFKLIIETGRKAESGLLAEWARWEWAFRSCLRIERLKKSGITPDDSDSLLPDFLAEDESNLLAHFQDIIHSWSSIEEPMKAEMFLDQVRIDFLREKASEYSFEIDELVAYMLELRIHARYARLNLDEGRKILEEVTAL